MSTSSFQTLTLEYRVFDQCDGTTDAPPFSDGVLDDRQIYVFEVQRLGVIPLRFGTEDANPASPSSPANRTLTWCVLTGVPTAFETYSGMSVGFTDRNLSANVPVEPAGQISAGSEGLYIRRCVKVPQGGVILVNDIEAPPGGPAIIRIRVQQTENGEQQHQLELACCCKETLPSIDLPDSGETNCPSSLNLFSIDPISTAISVSAPIIVTLTGSGFSSLGTPSVAFVESGAVPHALPVSSITVIDDTTVTVSVLPNLEGVYSVFIGDPDIQNCFATIQDGFQVTLR